MVAKNYLAELKISRLVSAYLDFAEDVAINKLPVTMQDRETRLNRFLVTTDREALQDAGKMTADRTGPR